MMSADNLGALRTHLLTLKGLEEVYGQTPGGAIRGSHISPLLREVELTNADLPGLLPPFSLEEFRGRWSPDYDRFEAAPLRAWLHAALSSLQGAIAKAESVPEMELLDFGFVKDAELRRVLTRDGLELQLVLRAGHWKSAIVLAGGAIEAILIDLLQGEPGALTAAKAPKKKSDITRWTLNDMIEVALELNAVNSSVANLSHAVREYRDLVHPGREVREKLAFGPEEARIGLEVLKILIRDRARAAGAP
jgi:hypothetical protein